MRSSMLNFGQRFDSAIYYLRVKINSTTETLAFSLNDTVNEYWCLGDGTTYDLLKKINDMLETHSVAASFSTKFTSDFKIRIQIETGASSFQILWDDGATTLDNWTFGFATTTTTATTSATGDFMPKGIWRPQRPVAIDSRPRQSFVGGIAKAIDGTIYSTQIATSAKTRRLEWVLLSKEKVLTEYASTPFESFEYGFENSARLGRTFHLYEDETKLAPTSRNAYRLSSFDSALDRSGDWNHLWDLSLDCVSVSARDLTQTYLSLDLSPGGYVTAGNALTGQTAFTISVWLQQPSSWVTDDIVIGQFASGQAAFKMQTAATGTIRFYFANTTSDTTTYAATPNSTFVSGMWYHVVFKFDAGTALSCYVNGVKKTLTWSGSSPGAITQNTSSLGIGNDGAGGLGFTGYIDDASIWERELSEAEVLRLYEAGNPREFPNLIRWFGLDGNLFDHVTGERAVHNTPQNLNFVSGYLG